MKQMSREERSSAAEVILSSKGSGVYNAILDLIDDSIVRGIFQLETATDTIKIYQSQGHIAALRELKRLISQES